MTASKLILHHTYSDGVAFDLSGNGNHGTLENVPIVGGNVQFTGGPQMVRVKASKTLTTLRGVRAQVVFRAAPFATTDTSAWGGGVVHDHRSPQRENLMEGYLSFAFFFNTDGSLQGTINSRGTGWVGVTTPPGTIAPNQWYTATFFHDGFATCKIYVDGNLVAAGYDAIGPVTAVAAPYGLAIGHWPNPGDQYTFKGEISEAKVWTDDPDPRHFFDECCIDRDGLDDEVDTFLAKGQENGQDMSAAGLGKVVDTILDVGHRVAGKASGGSQANRDQVRDLTEQGMLAFGTGDRQALLLALHGMNDVLTSRVPAAETADDWGALLGAIDATPFGPPMRQMVAEAAAGVRPTVPDEMSSLLGPLCLDWLQTRQPTKPVRPGTKPRDGTHRPTSDIPDDWGDDADRHDDPAASDGDGLPPGPDWDAWDKWASQQTDDGHHDEGGPT